MLDTEILIVGGGIAGCLAACELSDLGFEVLIIDQREEVMQGASRWNEGKIHLGYTYLGRDSMNSVRLMLEGAHVFTDHIERISGSKIADEWWSDPVIYLVDDHSLLPAPVLWQRAKQATDLLLQMARTRKGLEKYLTDLPPIVPIVNQSAQELTGQRGISAAWQTVERAIDPKPVGALVRKAVRERGVAIRQGTVQRFTKEPKYWSALTEEGTIHSRWIINASWESRALLDRSVTGEKEAVSIRYKYALFGENSCLFQQVKPSTRILGPYGDVTPYQNGSFCLSWYPANLVASSDDGTPPVIIPGDRQEVRKETMAALHLKESDLHISIDQIQVKGGYVVAHGFGDIDDLASPLHDRSKPNARLLQPGYVSIDTGKYSLGPLMASRATQIICKAAQRSVR